MKERAIVLASMGLLAILVGVALTMRRGEYPGPEAVIYASFDAASAGDIDAYLQCFGPQFRSQLRSVLHEVGRQRFSRDIRSRATQITGLALSRKPSSTTPGTEIFRLEQVFKDRNETQDFHLRQSWGKWYIVQLGAATAVNMPIPYGTLVLADQDSSANRTPNP